MVAALGVGTARTRGPSVGGVAERQQAGPVPAARAAGLDR
jgi:hypothetical protein